MEEVIKSRSLLWLLVKRELRSQYAGSILGALWNIIHPLFLIGIYIVVFSSVMHQKAGTGSGSSYVVFLCAGLIPWLVFQEIVQRSTGLLGENANFLKKLAIPHEILHVSVFCNSVIIHSVSTTALILLLLLFGVHLGPAVLLSYPILVGVGLVAMGFGMALSVLNLLLKDIGQITTIALQILFWMTPIVYFPSILPKWRHGLVFKLLSHNPILGYIAGMQTLFGSTQAAFQSDSIYMMVFLPFAAIWVGREVLYRHRSELLDLL